MKKEEIKELFTNARLTIELVPKTCWFSNVRDHLSKSQWRKISNFVAEKADHHCEICGSQGKKHRVECHEIWNYNDKELTQTLAGLIALCPACHRVKHIGRTSEVGNLQYSIYQLARVNKWSEQLARLYYEVSMLIWQKRSQFQWKLDLSYIEREIGIRIEEKR
jgi:hypothetical protein